MRSSGEEVSVSVPVERSALKKVGVVVACFLVLACYFVSESLLRVAAARGILIKGIAVGDVVSKLPEGVRFSVESQIDLAVARDALASAKTDREVIDALLSLGMLQGEREFKEANSKILDEYPNSPAARSAYSFFFLAPPQALRSVDPQRYRAYVETLPEDAKLGMWTGALRRFVEVGYPPDKIFEFFEPLLENPPIYREYESFFMGLSELAFRNDMREWEGVARRLEDACAKAPSLFDLNSAGGALKAP
jgi:hypothetical protein